MSAPAFVREYAYGREEDARRQRREFIESGCTVSLLSFDPSRNRYVFDVTGRA